MIIAIPLFLGWLSFLIYGIVLLRASKHRKTGITLITLFFAPIVLVAFLVWYMDYEYLSCMLNGSSETIDYCRSLQSYILKTITITGNIERNDGRNCISYWGRNFITYSYYDFTCLWFSNLLWLALLIYWWHRSVIWLKISQDWLHTDNSISYSNRIIIFGALECGPLRLLVAMLI